MCLNKQVVPPPIFLPNFQKKNNPPQDGVVDKSKWPLDQQHGQSCQCLTYGSSAPFRGCGPDVDHSNGAPRAPFISHKGIGNPGHLEGNNITPGRLGGLPNESYITMDHGYLLHVLNGIILKVIEQSQPLIIWLNFSIVQSVYLFHDSRGW